MTSVCACTRPDCSGSDPSLVLHGGGNTSVKTREATRAGEQEDVLWVKGNKLLKYATIDGARVSPVRLDRLRALARLETLGPRDGE